MKTKKQKIIIGGLVVIVIITSLLIFNRIKVIPIAVPVEQNYLEDKALPETEIINKKNVEKDIITTENNVKKIIILLNVLGKEYKTEIKEGSSVFESMKNLEENNIKDNAFNFKYTDNAGMGSFITEINGAKGVPGKYWIYYVKGKLASVGVSKYVVKDGDIISWKQEGI